MPESGLSPGSDKYSTSPSVIAVTQVPQLPALHPESIGMSLSSANSKREPASADAGSLLEFAEDNDIPMDSGCRAGNCGTCVTAITDGEVEYLSEPGDKPDSGTCLTCISVPKNSMTLDA